MTSKFRTLGTIYGIPARYYKTLSYSISYESCSAENNTDVLQCHIPGVFLNKSHDQTQWYRPVAFDQLHLLSPSRNWPPFSKNHSIGMGRWPEVKFTMARGDSDPPKLTDPLTLRKGRLTTTTSRPHQIILFGYEGHGGEFYGVLRYGPREWGRRM